MSAIIGETLIFKQDNGPDVGLVVFGDEFYARYETKDGYTVVYDCEKGLYCYAVLLDGQLISSGTPIAKYPPPELRRGLREDELIRNEKFEKRYADLRQQSAETNANANRTRGPMDGLLLGRRVSQGEVRGLTILVEFADLTTEVTASDVDAMLNGDAYQENGNFSSVREYFRLMSDGKLDYTNQVIGPIKLSRNQRYYIQNLLCKEALDKAIDEWNVDLSQFDSRNEGIVDALSFMYAGRTVYEGDLWPHNASLDLNYGGIKVNLYTIQSLGRQRVDLSIGTFCHESGHLLCRFPDLYDYGVRDGDSEKSSGMGRYCLMSSGNHLNRGRTPAPICGYLRDLVGWCDRKVRLNDAGIYQVKHGDYGTLMKYHTRRLNEYFIIENRTQQGLDAYLPASGLAVLHCDTLGSNEWQGGTRDRHYQCGLLQADGHLDLETNRNNGDVGDLYSDVAGVALSYTTSPTSRSWDGTDSGLIVADISKAQDVMRVAVGPVEPATVAKGELTADLLIPDNLAEGASSAISISQAGKVKTVKVSVDITHTYIGDLQVELSAPSGKTVMLHDRLGRANADLKKTYSVETTLALADFSDERVDGDWQLTVRDRAAQDIGRLNFWSLEIGYEATEKQIREEVTPNLPIPDNQSVGIDSRIAIAESGTLKEIAVEVAIEHAYVGDLLVEIVAPSGQSVTLHDLANGSQSNLNMTCTHASIPALEALVNQPIQGEWTLRVKDLQRLDSGQLKTWALQLKY